MDAKRTKLDKKLSNILKEASRVACEIQAIDQGPGVPHYDEIEDSANEVGQRLNRMMQTERAGDIAAEQDQHIDCPDCGRRCPVEVKKRKIQSSAGPVELVEPVAHCRHCRRSFFPSA